MRVGIEAEQSVISILLPHHRPRQLVHLNDCGDHSEQRR
jgi:hypothetical protein